MSDFVRGHCPVDGGRLFLGDGGYITCSALRCPRPDAAATLLDDPEREHLVTFEETGFLIRHPLRERLDDALERCTLHAYITALDGPPVAPGRYRACARELGGWSWHPVNERAEEAHRG